MIFSVKLTRLIYVWKLSPIWFCTPHKNPSPQLRPPSRSLFSSRATARICDRSISNPFSRHSGARVNNPPLMRIVHLLCHVPRAHFWQYVFIFLTQAKFRFVLPPNWVKGGTERVQRFFFTIPVRTLWGAASRPLLYILSQYCDPPAAIYGWPLKCTLQHSGFGTANCNNFYNPRTSLDVTPTPPLLTPLPHSHILGGYRRECRFNPVRLSYLFSPAVSTNWKTRHHWIFTQLRGAAPPPAVLTAAAAFIWWPLTIRESHC